MSPEPRKAAQQFFAAYQRGDAEAMCRLLHPRVVFNDRAFTDLSGDDVHTMWRWFCTPKFGRRRDRVRVPSFEITGAGGDKVDVRYRVQYELFRDKQAAATSGTRPERSVDYVISSALLFRDGLICRQTDTATISPLRFAYMVAGLKGCLGVLLGRFDAKIREQAGNGLKEFHPPPPRGGSRHAVHALASQILMTALAAAAVTPQQQPTSRDLAVRQMAEGNYAEARTSATRAIAEARGAEPCEIARLHRLLGLAEGSLGRLKAAETVLELGVGLCERQVPASPETMVALLVALGESYTAGWRFADAERVLRRAAKTAEAGLTPDDAQLATVWDATGVLQFSQGKTGLAEKSFRRALAILENSVGASHPDTALRSLFLASLLVSTGRESEALPMIERSRGVLLASRGRSHPDTVSASLTLAVARMATAPVEAETLLRETLAARTATQPAGDLTTAKLWNGLALAQFQQRSFAEAAESGAQALAVVTAALGPEHRETVRALYSQAHFLAAAKRKKEAAAARQQADRIRADRGYADPGRHAVDVRSLLRERR